MTTIQAQIESVANQLINAKTEADREALRQHARALHEAQAMLAGTYNPAPIVASSRGSKAPANKGRAKYNRNDVKKVANTHAISWMYTQYINGVKGETERAEGVVLGYIVTSQRNQVCLAIELVDSVLDLVAGDIIAIASTSLKDITVIE